MVCGVFVSIAFFGYAQAQQKIDDTTIVRVPCGPRGIFYCSKTIKQLKEEEAKIRIERIKARQEEARQFQRDLAKHIAKFEEQERKIQLKLTQEVKKDFVPRERRSIFSQEEKIIALLENSTLNERRAVVRQFLTTHKNINFSQKERSTMNDVINNLAAGNVIPVSMGTSDSGSFHIVHLDI